MLCEAPNSARVFGLPPVGSVSSSADLPSAAVGEATSTCRPFGEKAGARNSDGGRSNVCSLMVGSSCTSDRRASGAGLAPPAWARMAWPSGAHDQ